MQPVLTGSQAGRLETEGIDSLLLHTELIAIIIDW
jgi:hypothetical protein